MAVSLMVVGWALTYLPMLDGLHDWDASISEELADSRSSTFESIAVFFSRLADTPSILAFAAMISIVLALARKWRAMAFVPLALVIEIACFGAVNYAVQRPRPDVVKVGSVPSTFSFPSGHVAATVVCWIGAALLLATFGRHRVARVVAGVGARDGGAGGVGAGVPRYALHARHSGRHHDGPRRALHRRASASAGGARRRRLTPLSTRVGGRRR